MLIITFPYLFVHENHIYTTKNAAEIVETTVLELGYYLLYDYSTACSV